jgi:hypothetical protein
MGAPYFQSPTPNPSDAPEERADGPRMLPGILTAVLVAPFILGIAAAVRDGAVKTAAGAALVAGSVLLLLAVPSHFFFGYKAPWILPILIVALGVMGVFAGVTAPDLRGVAFGLLLLALGLLWHFSERLPDSVRRFIGDLKGHLGQTIGK